MSMDISDFYQTFFDEADELLADMEQHLLVLQPEAPDAEQLNAIFRAAHSIKGGAGTFGFSVLQGSEISGFFTIRKATSYIIL